MSIQLSLFNGPISNITNYRKITLKKLTKLKPFTGQSKENSPYFTRCKIRPKTNRSNKNVIWPVEILILDLDKPSPGYSIPKVKQAAKVLTSMGLSHFVYPSWTKGNIRCVVPCSPVHDEDALRAATKSLFDSFCRAGDYHLKFAYESATASQAWFIPVNGARASNLNLSVYNFENVSVAPDWDSVSDGGKSAKERFISDLKSGTIHAAAKNYITWLILREDKFWSYKKCFRKADKLILKYCSNPDKIERWFDSEREKMFNWSIGNLEDPERANVESSGKWIEPIPLHKKPEIKLSKDMMPKILWDMVSGVSRTIEVPEELPFVVGLTALAAVIQGKKSVIQIKDQYTEPLSFWGLVVLPPGSRKSEAEKQMFKAVRKLNVKLVKRIFPKIEKAKLALKMENEVIKSFKAQLRNSKIPLGEKREIKAQIVELEEEKTRIPPTPCLWADDITVEALAVSMACNNNKMSISSAEGGIFEIIAGRYSNGNPNLDLYLKGYSGDAVKIDRIGKKDSIIMEETFLSLGLCVQPQIISDISNKMSSFKGMGLIDRFLTVIPDNKIGSRELNGGKIKRAIIVQYESLIEDLYNENNYRVYLTKSQFKKWRKLSLEIEKKLGDDKTSCKSWIAKHVGRVMRIAGLFHHVLSVGDDNEGKTFCNDKAFEMALKLEPFLFKAGLYGRRSFDTHGERKRVEKVIQWIKFLPDNKFSTRECHNKFYHFYPKAFDVRELLHFLDEYNYIERIYSKYPKGKRRTEMWKINPLLK